MAQVNEYFLRVYGNRDNPISRFDTDRQVSLVGTVANYIAKESRCSVDDFGGISPHLTLQGFSGMVFDFSPSRGIDRSRLSDVAKQIGENIKLQCSAEVCNYTPDFAESR